MTPEQAAAFIIAQAACASADIAAMTLQNTLDAQAGRPPTYPPGDLMSIPDRYGIGHNAVLTFFQGVAR